MISKFRGFIEDCVRHHHERWDGQGYPLINGEEYTARGENHSHF